MITDNEQLDIERLRRLIVEWEHAYQFHVPDYARDTLAHMIRQTVCNRRYCTWRTQPGMLSVAGGESQ